MIYRVDEVLNLDGDKIVLPPEAVQPGVYILADGEDVIYVGQSARSVEARLNHHRQQGKVFDRFDVIPVEAERLNDVEAHFILTAKPRHNRSVPLNHMYLTPKQIRRYWAGSVAELHRALIVAGVTGETFGLRQYFDFRHLRHAGII